jgi:hypothetical protein
MTEVTNSFAAFTLNDAVSTRLSALSSFPHSTAAEYGMSFDALTFLDLYQWRSYRQQQFQTRQQRVFHSPAWWRESFLPPSTYYLFAE